MIKIWFIAYTHISFPPKWIGCNGWFSFYTQQCSDWLYRPCVRLASSQNRNDVNLLIATRWNRCVQSHAMHIAVLIPVRWNGFLLKVRRNKSIFRHEHFISGARSKTTIPLNENLFLSSFFFPVVVCNLVQYYSTNARILRRIELNLIMNFKNLFEIIPILPRWFVHSQPQFSQCVLKLQFCVPLGIVLITRISISRRKETYTRKCDWFHSSQKQFTTTAAAAAREIHKKAVKEWIIAHSDWFATKSVGWCVLKIDGDRMKIVFP